MTAQLEKAFAEASKLSPSEQDALAEWLFAELQSEKRWTKQFADSQNTVSKLASEALAEHHSGHTQELDLNRR
jgi:hypothetical protein